MADIIIVLSITRNGWVNSKFNLDPDKVAI